HIRTGKVQAPDEVPEIGFRQKFGLSLLVQDIGLEKSVVQGNPYAGGQAGLHLLGLIDVLGFGIVLLIIKKDVLIVNGHFRVGQLFTEETRKVMVGIIFLGLQEIGMRVQVPEVVIGPMDL